MKKIIDSIMRTNLFTLFLLLITYPAFTQILKGKIVDEYEQPIQEANILNKNTEQNTYSNFKGDFSLEKVSIGDTLQVSYIGFQTSQVFIKNLEKSLTIVLGEEVVNLNEIVISPKLNALNLITDIDIQTNPVNSSQDVLRKVPGLFIGQHAGGGKAEQIFLRGFDIDHGTDINIAMDGLPVNMVSHAHGQGYADLHFIIPETIDKIDFGKGLYYQDKGNFNTAGYVDFLTKQNLENNSIKLEAGQFDTYRLLSMFNVLKQSDHNAYIATEFLFTDGPFESPQNFNRINFFGKYTGGLSNTDKIRITASHFNSKWDASGQVPQRAIDNGLISRFGAIDDTEGGTTFRNNLMMSYDKILNESALIKSNVYLSQYGFELYSNFTFFLEDPINGDQIRQKENRRMYGFDGKYIQSFSTNKFNGNWQIGISLRNDQSMNNELSHTLNRTETLRRIRFGNIGETNMSAFSGMTIDINKWTFNPAIRIDYFDFQYNDALLVTYKTLRTNRSIVSPKLNILYNPSNKLQLYLKMGKGFHSNDTRAAISEGSGEILPAAYGLDIGYIWKPNPSMLLNVAFWYLYLEQEFVYVGDAGIIEPSGKTRRQGIDLSYRYQPLAWLFWNLDANYAYARSIDESKENNYIPLAPDFTAVSGFNFIFKSGLYGSVNIRHLANRPANENNSIRAKGYTITDLNIGYKWKKLSLGIQIQNVFNTKWNETQFATESRLDDEIEPVEEIHFTPGTPFFIKNIIKYNF